MLSPKRERAVGGIDAEDKGRPGAMKQRSIAQQPDKPPAKVAIRSRMATNNPFDTETLAETQYWISAALLI